MKKAILSFILVLLAFPSISVSAYLGSWKIDNTLTFYCNTHSATDGTASDAASVPTYRVYEDETGTTILNGSMAKLDDSNTVGFYSEQITLSAANGLEKGKSYVIYISATVGSVDGTKSDTFQIEAEVDANVVSDKTGYGISEDARTSITGGAHDLDTDANGRVRIVDGTGAGELDTTSGKVDVNTKTGFTAAPTAGSITSSSFDGSTAYPLAAASSSLATSSELAKVPKSDGTATWNATALASLQAEATDALNAYDPPTKTEMDTAFTEIKGATFSTDTDQLEDIRDRGDFAWITATGFSTHDAAAVKTAIEADGSKLDHVWEMTEDDGGVRRLTANALEQAPVAWTTGEKEQIRDALGVDGTKTTAVSGDLQAINDVVASATYGNAALKTLLDLKPDTTDLADENELSDTFWSAEDRTITSGAIVWSEIVESGSLGSLTAEEAVRLLLSFVAGEATGAGTSSVTFYRANDEDNTAGLVMTVDANGNRSAVTIDVADIP